MTDFRIFQKKMKETLEAFLKFFFFKFPINLYYSVFSANLRLISTFLLITSCNIELKCIVLYYIICHVTLYSIALYGIVLYHHLILFTILIFSDASFYYDL